MPCSIDMCQKCPSRDLNKVITIEGDTTFNPYTFGIKHFEPKEPLMLFCEAKDYSWTGKGTCAVTVIGDTNDILNLMKNIEIKVQR